MIRALGCSHVIVGHSERRKYFGETNESVLEKPQRLSTRGSPRSSALENVKRRTRKRR
jgi:triosephosphate isomerase